MNGRTYEGRISALSALTTVRHIFCESLIQHLQDVPDIHHHRFQYISLLIRQDFLIDETNTHTHHTHFQVQGLEKGVSENEAPGPVGAYTTTHNDTITLMPNLIHRISFTELKFECRTRVAEGTSAGRSTLRHNRTHAPTGPRRARTYMRI